eukprot:Polyplicarium_translucidae@DN2368_c0_g1_i3.p4
MQYRNASDCFRQMVASEGTRSLYAGLLPAVGLVPHAAVQIYLYEELKRRAGPRRRGDLRPLHWGFVSKFVAAVAFYPLSTVRARQQMQASTVGRMGLVRALSSMYHQGGILCFYRGMWVHLQRACVHSAALFFAFELLDSERRKARNGN